MTTVLAWTNVVALFGVGGLLTLYSLIPFAMANDDPNCGPLVKYGFLQIAGLGGLGVSVVVGAWVASRAANHDGWTSLGLGAAGWGTWIGGVVLTMASYFGLAALDMAAGRRRRRNRDRSASSRTD